MFGRPAGRFRQHEGNPPLATPPTNSPAPPGARLAHGDPTGPIPLNAFQRIIRGWERVHPYNAAQAMEVRRPAVDPAAAAAAWAATLDEMKLGRVEARAISYRHVGLNGEAARYPLRVLPAGTSLDAFFAEEMNRPFADPGEPPFRPFLMPDPAAGTCHLGVVYQHWVADSVAVRHVLRRWLERLFLPPGQHARRPIRHAGIGYFGLLGTAPGSLSAVQTVLSVIRRHLRYRRARKVRAHGPADYPVGVVLAESRGLVPALVAAARNRGAKVNDLFLAAAARACDARVPAQARRNRPDLAVASIVDLRPLARAALDDRFGLFLGFSEVVCRPADLRSADRLVATVAGQNRTHRHHGVWPATVGWLAAALIARPLVPPAKLYHFFRKEAPLTAGVSNVNLNRTWAGRHAADLLARYRRVSPTGPLAPVVFSVTTLGDDLQVSLTYRVALLTADQARNLADAFLAELAALTGAG
ncbi:MAG: hypothetical protein JWO31_2912 [Phycisphaerales bacterium]|nr:hypothetical protein [Phycisphaerales bacterium]